ncbi:MAG: DivIVA domain-containing protein [Trueperaceae bacterium]|nr:MAG: DivIVA domain-containing protein [Trueperaceae bacterium]
MKLSPLDIQHMEFATSVNGFNKKQVRSFLERIANERQELLREIQSIREELQKRELRIEDLQTTEMDLKRAVIAAERIGNEVKESAKREANLILKEADRLKEDIIRDAEAKLKEARSELANLERQNRLFREQFRGMLHAYERSLDNLPAKVPVKKAP